MHKKEILKSKFMSHHKFTIEGFLKIDVFNYIVFQNRKPAQIKKKSTVSS